MGPLPPPTSALNLEMSSFNTDNWKAGERGNQKHPVPTTKSNFEISKLIFNMIYNGFIVLST